MTSSKRKPWTLRIRRGGAYDDITVRSPAGQIVYDCTRLDGYRSLRRELHLQINKFVRELFGGAP